jgi:hypothetical protein
MAATATQCAVAFGNATSNWKPCVNMQQQQQQTNVPAKNEELIQRIRKNMGLRRKGR